MGLHTDPFDPKWDFKASTFVRILGQLYTKGDPIIRTGLEDRRLEMIYNARKVERDLDSAGTKTTYLIDNNTQVQLFNLAEEIDGAKSSMTKTELATLIVKAGLFPKPDPEPAVVETPVSEPVVVEPVADAGLPAAPITEPTGAGDGTAA